MTSYLNIAVEGCCHGELDIIYDTIRDSERHGAKVDLLLVCGDFQCVRNTSDLECLAVPQKFRKLNTFHQYVAGEKVAYVPTIFIGGNHEASNILQSLYYGGWVAHNIYFLGFGGVVWFGGVRIAGISGIFNKTHYRMGHFERPPYTQSSMRSVYHQRELEVFRLAMLSGNIDVFLSHDWPTSIWEYGDKQRLLQTKPYFREEMAANDMGSPPLMHLLRKLKPSMWFSAHLHVKFAAVVQHLEDHSSAIEATSMASSPSLSPAAPVQVTRFLALDKVLPGRDFLQILKVPRQGQPDEDMFIQHDAQWLAILRKTHSLLSCAERNVMMPSVYDEVTSADIEDIYDRMYRAYGGMRVPIVTSESVPSLGGQGGVHDNGNMQTDKLISALGLTHVWTRPAVPVDGISRGFSGAPLRPDVMPPSSWMDSSADQSSPQSSAHRHFENEEASTNSGIDGQLSEVYDGNAISIDDVDDCNVECMTTKVVDSNEIDIDSI